MVDSTIQIQHTIQIFDSEKGRRREWHGLTWGGVEKICEEYDLDFNHLAMCLSENIERGAHTTQIDVVVYRDYLRSLSED